MLNYNDIGHGVLVSEQTRLGTWTIKPELTKNDSARVSFVPNLGKSFEELREDERALRKSLEAQGKDPIKCPEYWLARDAYFCTQEFMTFETRFEAQHIVDFIESLPPEIPSWKTTLDKMGFEPAYDPVKHPTLKGVFHMKSNTRFTLSLSDEPTQTMWLRYEPDGPSWHNLAHLDAITESHSGEFLIPRWWPQGYAAMDLMALVVERIVLIRTTQKKPPRFKPTEPITHI